MPRPEKFCEFFNGSMSIDIQRNIRRMMVLLYENGSYDAWDLTRGGSNSAARALEMAKEMDLIGSIPRECFITDKGIEFVEKYRLSKLVP